MAKEQRSKFELYKFINFSVRYVVHPRPCGSGNIGVPSAQLNEIQYE